ncbi:MAG TPA: LCP family protein, partial [Anaerolineales bacterium]|nr:LCP family protein [Anaerolineales bacterium]
MTNSEQDKNFETKPVKASWLKYAVWGGLVVAALLTAYLTFVAVRDLVASWEMTSLPGVTIRDATPTPGGEGEVVRDPSLPMQPAGAPTPLPWDGANRVSLLVMGLDYRDWAAGEGPPRTDTMILFTIDPINRTAGILSIPRDLWVNIPGFDYGRINSAYQLGEAYTVVGGGPQLATDTVEELLGVPIDYYAQVDFGAFVRFIDEIGGVKLDVPEPIKIDPLGDNTSKTLKTGIQTLPGDLALAYVRARKTEGGDFDRAQRQQQVILAIRNRILEFDMLPNLISKAPVLYEELSAGIRTNLSLDLAIRLAW